MAPNSRRRSSSGAEGSFVHTADSGQLSSLLGHSHLLRIAPPLTPTEDEITLGVQILDQALTDETNG